MVQVEGQAKCNISKSAGRSTIKQGGGEDVGRGRDFSIFWQDKGIRQVWCENFLFAKYAMPYDDTKYFTLFSDLRNGPEKLQ